MTVKKELSMFAKVKKDINLRNRDGGAMIQKTKIYLRNKDGGHSFVESSSVHVDSGANGQHESRSGHNI
jgi:hypothetical protein